MGKLFLILVVLALGWLAGALDLMLTIGIMHRDWWAFIPLMGYHSALAIVSPVFFFGVIVGLIKGLTGDGK
jgi:hypothetical protein